MTCKCSQEDAASYGPCDENCKFFSPRAKWRAFRHLFPSEGWGIECGDYIICHAGLTEESARRVVDLHNAVLR